MMFRTFVLLLAVMVEALFASATAQFMPPTPPQSVVVRNGLIRFSVNFAASRLRSLLLVVLFSDMPACSKPWLGYN
jgi:hypothetical protein